MAITTLDLPTNAQLAEILHESGAITPETSLIIETLVAETHESSTLFHMQVHAAGSPTFPRHIVLKSSYNGGAEVRFYQQIRSLNGCLPVVPCMGTRHNFGSSHSQVVLEDISASHSNICDWPSALPDQATRELIESLAKLHAAFWRVPNSGRPLSDLPDFLQDEASYEAYLAFTARDLDFYASRMGGDLSPELHRFYRSTLSTLAGLWEIFWTPRLQSGGLTLIHGNLNPCNVLYPKHSGGKVYFVDWESCHTGLPANDLAMLLGLHLCPDQDGALPLLRHYHDCLCQSGICGYTIDDLLADYQTALLYELFTPIKRYTHHGILDENMIENSISALESCDESLF